MCGIVGLFNMKNAEGITFSEKQKSFLIKYLLTGLILETETRGRDATGYCALFENGDVLGLKHGVKASKFIEDQEDDKLTFRNHIKLIDAYHNEVSPAISIVAHCRAKTVGSETINDNNHPIYVDNFIGIHNGCLSNQSTILKNIQEEINLKGEVDSELIFQLIWLATDKGKNVFSKDAVDYITERIEGSYSIITLDKKNPSKVLFVRNTRPIEFVYIKNAGLLVAVSEQRFFNSVKEKYNRFDFYGLDFPKLETECYSFPDNSAFILDTNTEIKEDIKIEEDLFKDRFKINDKIISKFKNYSSKYYGSYYNRTSGGYNSHHSHSSYLEDKEFYNNTVKPSSDNKNDNVKVSSENNKEIGKTDVVKTGKNNEHCTAVEQQTTENLQSQRKVRIVTWNKKTCRFDTSFADVEKIYIPEQNFLNSKYTIFKNMKSLATKLDVPLATVTSYTLPQIANKVSKIVYDEYFEKSTNLVSEIKKLEEKQERARKHIITLRNIVNTLLSMLGGSGGFCYFKEKYENLTQEKKENLSKLWLFINKREVSKESSLGKFIQSVYIKGNNIKKTESSGEKK